MTVTLLNLRTAAPQDNATKAEWANLQIDAWKQKALHRHLYELGTENVDREASNYWLTRRDIFPEAKYFIMAIQDQVVTTKNYLKYIIRNTSMTDDKYKRYLRTSEIIQHITARYTFLPATEYLLQLCGQKCTFETASLPQKVPVHITGTPLRTSWRIRTSGSIEIGQDLLKKLLSNWTDIIFVNKTRRRPS